MGKQDRVECQRKSAFEMNSHSFSAVSPPWSVNYDSCFLGVFLFFFITGYVLLMELKECKRTGSYHFYNFPNKNSLAFFSCIFLFALWILLHIFFSPEHLNAEDNSASELITLIPGQQSVNAPSRTKPQIVFTEV